MWTDLGFGISDLELIVLTGSRITGLRTGQIRNGEGRGKDRFWVWGFAAQIFSSFPAKDEKENPLRAFDFNFSVFRAQSPNYLHNRRVIRFLSFPVFSGSPGSSGRDLKFFENFRLYRLMWKMSWLKMTLQIIRGKLPVSDRRGYFYVSRWPCMWSMKRWRIF